MKTSSHLSEPLSIFKLHPKGNQFSSVSPLKSEGCSTLYNQLINCICCEPVEVELTYGVIISQRVAQVVIESF
ncbi:hypothetical protein PISMIDRAFT_553463 [Pisolithus microcarpus 441]|uniref:Uncharacterized protein n=1 Tax=Pisolithus microcarpus 441 TaxID=765257 RepID=A0A0C9YUT1_9AGAM|nr:hypothetical protein PISMIDRAFT_553463 [Pisolithus microcarpus 441]